jgi:hypothetical protein
VRVWGEGQSQRSAGAPRTEANTKLEELQWYVVGRGFPFRIRIREEDAGGLLLDADEGN